MDDDRERGTQPKNRDGSADIVARVEELGARCETLENSNAFLAAQLTEVNQAWRDAIAAIAAAGPESATAQANAMQGLAAQSDGLRQQVFTEMARILGMPEAG